MSDDYHDQTDEQRSQANIIMGDAFLEGVPGINAALTEAGLPTLHSEQDFRAIFGDSCVDVLQLLITGQWLGIFEELAYPDCRGFVEMDEAGMLKYETLEAMAAFRLHQQLGGLVN